MIQPERIQVLNDAPRAQGQYVLYWMQASQRAEGNHAFEFAIEQANELKIPLAVFFGVTARFPRANTRHYRFMFEGLRETRLAMEARGASVVIQKTEPDEGAIALARRAVLVVTDRGYTAIQRRWRENVADKIACPLFQVESDVVVPVETSSDKQEYSAATLRRKIQPKIAQYMRPLDERLLKARQISLDVETLDIEDIDLAINSLGIASCEPIVSGAKGGAGEAKRLLREFVCGKIADYAEARNDPTIEGTSGLSPYLHFGQISPLQVALDVSGMKNSGTKAFLEELIVRRELAINFVFYNPKYDVYECVPDWARKSLSKHLRDKRQYVYSVKQLEEAKTHDPYWNAAQIEMMKTGRMHGYMRMYWGKKIIEWSSTPEEAFKAAILLNDKYELDGRDPNGYAGVAWCFGLHDRPWVKRKIFGNVRYMNDNGLRRKFDADRYVDIINAIARC